MSVKEEEIEEEALKLLKNINKLLKKFILIVQHKMDVNFTIDDEEDF